MPQDDLLLCVYAPSRTAIEKRFALYGGRSLLFRSSASSSIDCHDDVITCALIWTLQAATGLITQRSMRWALLIVSCFFLNCASVHCSGATLPPRIISFKVLLDQLFVKPADRRYMQERMLGRCGDAKRDMAATNRNNIGLYNLKKVILEGSYLDWS